jgi:hypothetical protein
MDAHLLARRVASALRFGFGLFVASLIRSSSLIEASVTGGASTLVFGTPVYPRFGRRMPNGSPGQSA